MNNSYLNTKFQYYPSDIRIVKPIGDITLYNYLYKIKNPSEQTITLFKQIEEASAIGDLKLKAELKAKTYYFTPCIFSDGQGRSYSNIKSWTGLMIIDVDGLTPEYAVEFKEYLFNTYKFFISVFLSASKRGVKGIVRIPICTSTDEFKSYFYGLMDKFQEYKGIDFSSKNCALANYLTYDRELLYRLDATEWNGKGIQIDEFKIYDIESEPLENVTEEDSNKAVYIFTKGIESIVDNAYPQMRSYCLMLGGFSGFGYINLKDAENLVKTCISNNEYMSKSTNHYIKNGIEFLYKGFSSPLPFKKHED